jgi:hypothetical protein
MCSKSIYVNWKSNIISNATVFVTAQSVPFQFQHISLQTAKYLATQWLFKHLFNFYITCVSLFPLISFSGVEWILIYENMKPALKLWFTKFTAEQITVVNECVFGWHRLPLCTVYKDTFGIPTHVVSAGEWLITNRNLKQSRYKPRVAQRVPVS